MSNACKYQNILVLIGGVNWGLIGIGLLVGAEFNDFNVINLIVGQWPAVEAIIYLIVGISAVCMISKKS